jgi:hypothetical protein
MKHPETQFLRATTFLLFLSVGLVGTYSIGGIAQKMSEEEAVQLTQEAAGGFAGTWVSAIPKGDYWYVFASSKSAQPPGLYVFNALSRKLLFKTDNSDAVQLEGTAKNSPKGALVILAEDIPVACPRLKQWPTTVVGKSVSVKGVLRRIAEADTKALELPLIQIDSQEYHTN